MTEGENIAAELNLIRAELKKVEAESRADRREVLGAVQAIQKQRSTDLARFWGVATLVLLPITGAVWNVAQTARDGDVRSRALEVQLTREVTGLERRLDTIEVKTDSVAAAVQRFEVEVVRHLGELQTAIESRHPRLVR